MSNLSDWPDSLIAVYSNGTVCISILHAAGDDPNSMYQYSLPFLGENAYTRLYQCTSLPQSGGPPSNRSKKFC